MSRTTGKPSEGFRSFIGWHQVPGFESSASSQDENPFSSPRTQPTGKVPVNYLQMSGCVERWRKTKSLSLKATLPVVLKLSWFLRQKNDMYADKKDFSWSKIACWTDAPAILNSFFSRIARQSLLSALAYQLISQDTLRRWERSSRHQSDWS